MWCHVCVFFRICLWYFSAYTEVYSPKCKTNLVFNKIFIIYLRISSTQQVILKPGTQMRDMYDALPFPLIFKVYFFNVLNPDDVMSGGKPQLEEIGPYVFQLVTYITKTITLFHILHIRIK